MVTVATSSDSSRPLKVGNDSSAFAKESDCNLRTVLRRNGVRSIFAFVFAMLLIGAAEKRPIYEDGTYLIYSEANSCALYVNYPDGDMLRISYKGTERTVFFTYFSSKFEKMAVDGEAFPIAFEPSNDEKYLTAGMGFIVQNNAMQKGLNTSGGVELLEMFQGARGMTIYGRGMMELVKFGTPNIDTALKFLKRCAADK